MEKIRIGLLGTVKTNIGDDFIREGLIHVITRIVRRSPVEFVTINKHEPHTSYPLWHPIRLCYAKGFRPRRKLGRIRRRAERWLPRFGLSRWDSCDVIVQCGAPVIWEGCRFSEYAKLIWDDIFARLARAGKPVLNLGGGSAYAIEQPPFTLIGSLDEEFIRGMLRSAYVTTARDKLAHTLFASLGYQIPCMPCPALLAGQANTQPVAPTRKVVLNYMPGGGHYDFGQNIESERWEDTFRKVVNALREQGWKLLFVCHSESELAVAGRVWPDVPRVLPAAPRDYFTEIRDAAFGVFNRLHASVGAAGLGVPSVSVGTDTRILMVEAVGLPAFYVKEATADLLLRTIGTIVRSREAEAQRLLALRESALKAHEELLRFVGCFGVWSGMRTVEAEGADLRVAERRT